MNARRWFAVPVSSFAVLVAASAVVAAMAGASADPLYLIALFVSVALVTDFRLQVGRLSSLPSVSVAASMLATASIAGSPVVILGIWTLGFFCGALVIARDLRQALYAAGLAALGATAWLTTFALTVAAGGWMLAAALLASAVYLLIILGVEFGRYRGRWSPDLTWGITGVSVRRVAGLVGVIGGLAYAILLVYYSTFTLVLRDDAAHQGAVLLLIVAVLIFGLARSRQVRGLQQKLRGLTDAALALPWNTLGGVGGLVTDRARQTVKADGVAVRQTPPGHDEIGYPVHLAPGDDQFLVASRELGSVPFQRDDERALEALAHLATEAARVTEDMADLTRKANSDSLTGLPNYKAFKAALEAANDSRSYSEALAVLFIDLDSFKLLNDRRGHHVGDLVLVTVAERLRASIRSSDIVARVGGDEFVVILTRLKSLAEAKKRADEVVDRTSEPFMVEGSELRPLLSVGLAYSAHRETDADSLVIDADRSMLAVKKSRRQGGPSAVSTINISPHRSARMNDIVARAIDEELLSVYFQPIVSMLENRIWAFEALVRYSDDELGAIAPGALVERAKSLGRMDELTRQVMVKAMSGARAIQLIEPSIATIAVNLEVGQIMDDHVGAFAKELVVKYPAISLCLELNERSLRYVSDELRAQAQALRDLGVIIALDDYGSENSSVGSLVRIPMDILKLDRSLIDDLADHRQREVIKALQGFSDSTDYLTIVEGIENAETADILSAIGVRHAQGYFYGTPASYEQVVDRLRRHGTVAVIP